MEFSSSLEDAVELLLIHYGQRLRAAVHPYPRLVNDNYSFHPIVLIGGDAMLSLDCLHPIAEPADLLAQLLYGRLELIEILFQLARIDSMKSYRFGFSKNEPLSLSVYYEHVYWAETMAWRYPFLAYPILLCYANVAVFDALICNSIP